MNSIALENRVAELEGLLEELLELFEDTHDGAYTVEVLAPEEPRHSGDPVEIAPYQLPEDTCELLDQAFEILYRDVDDEELWESE